MAHLPGSLARHLAAHGWRVKRYRDGVVDLTLGQAVWVGGVDAPASRASVIHLEVVESVVPHSYWPRRLYLTSVTVLMADEPRTKTLPPCILSYSPAPRLRLVAAGD